MAKKSKEPQQPTLYTPAEVANFFRVDPKTVTRWARSGTLNPVTLPSGHRRYHAEEIHELLQGKSATAPENDVDPAEEPRLAVTGRARAVLRGVVRDYFDGDAGAAIRVLSGG
ncbi:helix-turn-helix domain-containing protein [Actinomadura rayongensis]|uniref:Helix-turn-helix domain-containing protein n=1 Tax=Actinomadura rayongensis TaxID=1429076 RepID=A0A6I4WAG7_9ACTN|nr:helix-turn-helix domain-containing protein [Actinomadura rayongensis]